MRYSKCPYITLILSCFLNSKQFKRTKEKLEDIASGNEVGVTSAAEAQLLWLKWRERTAKCTSRLSSIICRWYVSHWETVLQRARVWYLGQKQNQWSIVLNWVFNIFFCLNYLVLFFFSPSYWDWEIIDVYGSLTYCLWMELSLYQWYNTAFLNRTMWRVRKRSCCASVS